MRLVVDPSNQRRAPDCRELAQSAGDELELLYPMRQVLLFADPARVEGGGPSLGVLFARFGRDAG